MHTIDVRAEGRALGGQVLSARTLRWSHLASLMTSDVVPRGEMYLTKEFSATLRAFRQDETMSTTIKLRQAEDDGCYLKRVGSVCWGMVAT